MAHSQHDSSGGTRGDLELGTIARLVDIAAARHGSAEALVDGDTRLDFTGLAAAARQAAAALMAAGVEPGDRVAVWAPNSWEWVVAALGIHRAGGVLVPINTRYRGGEAAYILAASRARVLFTVTDFLGTSYPALLAGHDLPALTRMVIMRGPAAAGALGWDEFLAGAAQVSVADEHARAAAVAPADTADILFTSGTTGRPKGVICSHAQTLRGFRDWSDVIGLCAGDRYLIVAPFFHCFGYKAGWLACLMMGATMLPQPVFDVAEVLARVPRDRVTVLPGPPALYQTILARPDLGDFDLSSLRLAVTGAANIPVELIVRMRRELGIATIITGYGLTESCGLATMCRFDDPPELIARTSGRAIPGLEVRVVDDRGVEVARGEPGEVVVRGYAVMSGYLDDPAETAAAIDSDGWLHTGDIGVMNKTGYLRITDRKKDMFIVGGFNAYPAEIESILLGHEALAQIAVVGAPDDRLGEIGVAYAVLRPGAHISSDELIAWSRERMANFKVPRRVEIVDALPMNASGKILKYELRKRARQGR